MPIVRRIVGACCSPVRLALYSIAVAASTAPRTRQLEREQQRLWPGRGKMNAQSARSCGAGIIRVEISLGQHVAATCIACRVGTTKLGRT